MLSMLPAFPSTGYKCATIFIYNYAHLYPKYSGICLGVLLPHPWTPLIIPSHFALGSRLPVLPHRRNASIRFDFGTLSLLSFWWFAFCFLLLAACRFLLACRVFGFCLDGKLQGFWHSFTALHPCTWFVQPKCLIKLELSTLARSFLYLPLSHSFSLSHTLSPGEHGSDVGQKAKYSISSTMKLRIPPCKWTAKYDLYATLVGSVSWPVGGTWMRFCDM